MSDEELRELALHGAHADAGARFAPFAGWNMPLQYSGIVAEHQAVRQRSGMFDVSHMGRIQLDGAGAGELLRLATTYDVRQMGPGEAHYALYCTEAGGIADDLFVYRLDEARWLVVHNAANAASDLERLRAVGSPASDVTMDTVMLAVQGPEARTAVSAFLGESVLAIRPRHCALLTWEGVELLVARTGYTGEDGFELISPAAIGEQIWERLLAGGVTPVGLGARDTLRLEAALPLHGHDIDATTNPYEAGLGWAVTLDDDVEFVGREALERLREAALRRSLAHLRLAERGVPRAGFAVVDPTSGERIATLTSGTFSPTLRTGIAMAYLPVERAEPGTVMTVLARDRPIAAAVVRRPFYRRPPG